MKYLIIGLGNFGRTLAEELTDRGHDVIGVDMSEHRVEEVKDRISLAYIMDAKEKASLAALPIKEVDVAVVAIGQSMEASLRAAAALKELKVRHIMARAIDPVHESILHAMDVNDIIIPERFAAKAIADKI